ncbi:MAG: glycosyl transferase family 1 [Marinilabiliales bacterium]|nr:MAG: glycosyl transferase family 1 [Marinilabiliales bacterium]
MRKVLIITYYWPPSGGGGVQRWLKFVKYFRNYGIEPVIFTPENPERPSVDTSLLDEIPDGIEIIKNKIWEPYSFYKKFTGRKKSDKIQTAFLNEKKVKSNLLENIAVWVRGNIFIPDARKYWIKPSVKLLSNYLNNNKIDAIVTTGPPHSAHLIGYQLKQNTGIPWLADFRDPWTNIDYYKDLKLGKRADKKHHKLEKLILEKADSISVISPGMQSEFMSIVNRNYHIIPNGYDSEDIIDHSITETDEFVLSHIGSMSKTRTPYSLLEALSELIIENKSFDKKLTIKNVGKIDMHALENFKKNNLSEKLEIVDYLPHNEVIAEQQSASMLLLLVNDTPNAKLILTGKIFEYLASKRPIICIAPEDGDAAKVIDECEAGKTFGFEEKEKLKRYLVESFEKFERGELVAKSKNTEIYSREKLTEKMAKTIEEICN